MRLIDVYNSDLMGFLSYKEGEWDVELTPLLFEEDRRYTLAHLYKECAEKKGSSNLRKIWDQLAPPTLTDLPSVLADDGFVRMYANATPISVSFFRQIWECQKVCQVESSDLKPIMIGETYDSDLYFDVDATPPGFLPKIFSKFRLERDPYLLENIQADLIRVSEIQEKRKRDFLTLAILAHGASYREIEGRILKIPSFSSTAPGVLTPYCFQQHLVWEGIKTVSAFPIIHEDKERAVYLCQGTEIWPSQPSMLGSIFANLGKEGSATEPYAHSWRRIHKHLRHLTKPLLPYVAGHSMGGALATQIALYSHPLIKKAFIFNPPAPEKRDHEMYRSLPEDVQTKLQVFASIDDLPFWRIGSSIIGQVTCFLGEHRWRYRPVKKWELLMVIPFIIKTIRNMINALPAHQRIVALLRSYIYFELSKEEIEKENSERLIRFDHIDFFPKLYSPAQRLLKTVRKFFGWELYDEYLKSQIEIIELQEADLKETLEKEDGVEVLEQLASLKKQKEELLKKLLKHD